MSHVLVRILILGFQHPERTVLEGRCFLLQLPGVLSEDLAAASLKPSIPCAPSTVLSPYTGRWAASGQPQKRSYGGELARAGCKRLAGSPRFLCTSSPGQWAHCLFQQCTKGSWVGGLKGDPTGVTVPPSAAPPAATGHPRHAG